MSVFTHIMTINRHQIGIWCVLRTKIHFLFHINGRQFWPLSLSLIFSTIFTSFSYLFCVSYLKIVFFSANILLTALVNCRKCLLSVRLTDWVTMNNFWTKNKLIDSKSSKVQTIKNNGIQRKHQHRNMFIFWLQHTVIMSIYFSLIPFVPIILYSSDSELSSWLGCYWKIHFYFVPKIDIS